MQIGEVTPSTFFSGKYVCPSTHACYLKNLTYISGQPLRAPLNLLFLKTSSFNHLESKNHNCIHKTRRPPWSPLFTPRSATKSLRRHEVMPTRSPLSKSSRRWRRCDNWWSYTDLRPTRHASPMKSGNGLWSFYAGSPYVRLLVPVLQISAD